LGGSTCDSGAYELATPTVTVNPGSNITRTTARLSAKVTANQVTATVQFEYGTTKSYGTKTAVQHVAGLTPVSVVAGLTGLKPMTTYHYAVIASSTDGTSVSTDRTFTTSSPPPPTISNLTVSPASVAPASGATVSFSDTAAGTVKFVVRRCTKTNATNQCTAYVAVGSFTHTAKAGANSFHLSAHLNGQALKQGSYQLQATPSAGGRTGNTLGATFRVT
jgi:hypothetical protein